jgi:endonuclease G
MSKNRERNKWLPLLLAAIFVFGLLYYGSRKLKSSREKPQQEGSRAGDHKLPYYNLDLGPDFGLPLIHRKDEIVRHTAYTLCYSEADEEASWVAYTLKADQLENYNRSSRTEDFREDADVPTGSALLNDYRRSGYDRGHLAPAADMRWSKTAMSESFLLSNITPQNHAFNEGIWNDLENAVRQWARKDGQLYIVTGPVLKGVEKKIGHSGVSVPSAFYKVVLDIRQPGMKAIGFIIPNAPGRQSFWKYAIPLDSVEKITGLDFFPALPDQLENVIEATIEPDAWYQRKNIRSERHF